VLRVSIVNLGERAVVIRDVRFARGRRGEQIATQYVIPGGGSFPKRLEPPEELELWFHMEELVRRSDGKAINLEGFDRLCVELTTRQIIWYKHPSVKKLTGAEAYLNAALAAAPTARRS